MLSTPGGFAWESVLSVWNAKLCCFLAKGCQHLSMRGGAGTKGGVSTFSKRGKIPSMGTP